MKNQYALLWGLIPISKETAKKCIKLKIPIYTKCSVWRYCYHPTKEAVPFLKNLYDAVVEEPLSKDSKGSQGPIVNEKAENEVKT